MENQDIFDDVTDTFTQQQKVLEYLKKKPLTTIAARNELFVMSIAARIFELKARGHNIHADRIGKKRIAIYTLLDK